MQATHTPQPSPSARAIAARLYRKRKREGSVRSRRTASELAALECKPPAERTKEEKEALRNHRNALKRKELHSCSTAAVLAAAELACSFALLESIAVEEDEPMVPVNEAAVASLIRMAEEQQPSSAEPISIALQPPAPDSTRGGKAAILDARLSMKTHRHCALSPEGLSRLFPKFCVDAWWQVCQTVPRTSTRWMELRILGDGKAAHQFKVDELLRGRHKEQLEGLIAETKEQLGDLLRTVGVPVDLWDLQVRPPHVAVVRMLIWPRLIRDATSLARFVRCNCCARCRARSDRSRTPIRRPTCCCETTGAEWCSLK